MGSHAREGARRRSRWSVLLPLALLACRAPGGPELPVVRRVPLSGDSARTLFVDRAERIWLGGAGELRRVGEAGGALRVPLDGTATPRVVGATAGRLYARAGDRLLVLDAATGETLARREEAGGPVLLDVRGRFLLRATPSGEVLGLHPGSLEPLWIWPSLGAVEAVALSPEGDRVHLAVPRASGAATLLSRDLQTGRAVDGEALSAPVSALRAGGRGELIAVVGAPGEQAVVALDPAGGGLRPLWRRSLRSLGLEEAPVEIRSDPRGERVALFSPGNENGLRVLRAETGELLGSVRRPLRDAAFGPDGSLLYVLRDAEVRVVRAAL